MNTVKVVSKILYYIAWILSIIYFAMAAISLLALTTTWGLHIKEGGKYFQVYYPFTKTPFLNGDYNLRYIVFYFLMIMILYGLFFWLLGNVFKVFYQPRLFTSYGIKHLRRFYLVNFTVPILVLLVISFFDGLESSTVALVTLHFTLGVFAWFFAAIFKQGVQLQNEQDLYI